MWKRYKVVLMFTLLSVLFAAFRPEQAGLLVSNTSANFLQMFAVIPPIFLLLGLLDQWVPRELVMKYMGRGAGLKGIVLSVLLGASSAGPLYGAFPFAAIMLTKGVRLANVVIFLSAWATLKIPMFLFEFSALGPRFAVFRWLINLPLIILIGYLVEFLLTDQEQNTLLDRAETQIS